MFGFLKKSRDISIISPMNGEVINLSEVPDEVFSQKMLGDGVGIRPSDGLVVSPCNGKIVQIFPTNHAIGIVTDEGIEILIHIGIDTVELNGQGFNRLVKTGEIIKTGDPLVEVDLQYIQKHGKSTITPVIITNMERIKKLSKHSGEVMAGKSEIMKVERKS